MKSLRLPRLALWSALTCTALLLTACGGTGLFSNPRLVVIAEQVRTPPPELLRLTEDGKLVHPCPRAALPVEYVDPATGRATTSAGELARFGQESDGFVGVCEGRVLLGAHALANGELARNAAERALAPRSWWQRLTPWRD